MWKIGHSGMRDVNVSLFWPFMMADVHLCVVVSNFQVSLTHTLLKKLIMLNSLNLIYLMSLENYKWMDVQVSQI